jgi:hypothetical protein
MLNRLKNALRLIVGAVVAVWAVSSLVGLVRAGPMEPWAPPGSTMKTVDAVEPRHPIWQPDSPGSFPIVISQPGSYYLGENITGVAGEDGIEITSSDVTLDLNGFALTGVPNSLNGISGPGGGHNLSIYNGGIGNWGGDAIHASGAFLSEFRDLRVNHNFGNGVVAASESTVINVIAEDNLGIGIAAGQRSIVKDSVSSQNGDDGIYVGDNAMVENCSVTRNGGDGIHVGAESLVVGNSVAWGTAGAGIHVTSTGSRIEANNVVHTAQGIDVDNVHNIIIKNTAWNATDYDIVAGNAVGAIIDCTGVAGCPSITADPWANFRY